MPVYHEQSCIMHPHWDLEVSYSRKEVMQVMKVVKSLSRMGITVVSTVHSPTPFCFGLFDQLLMLLRGKVIYFGPTGQCLLLQPKLALLHATLGTALSQWLVLTTVHHVVL